VKPFHALTDEELAACDWKNVVASYKELRDHHVAQIEALTKKDRSAILRMAGNIAPGLYQANYPDLFLEENLDKRDEGVMYLAKNAVEVARAIVTEVDRPNE